MWRYQCHPMNKGLLHRELGWDQHGALLIPVMKRRSRLKSGFITILGNIPHIELDPFLTSAFCVSLPVTLFATVMTSLILLWPCVCREFRTAIGITVLSCAWMYSSETISSMCCMGTTVTRPAKVGSLLAFPIV